MPTKIIIDRGVSQALDTKSAYRGMQAGLSSIGRVLTRTARAGIRNPPKTGRVYIINGQAHQASAPMEYPANLTGALQDSIKSVTDNLTLEFGSSGDLKYAPMLQQFETPEQRTSNYVQLAPRPYLTKAHDTVKFDFVRYMTNAIEKELKI